MRDWFPFTNYDFYAYLTTGMIVIAACDRAFAASTLANQEWTFVAAFFWIVVAYLVGQILAIPSSALLEHVVARHCLRSPTSLLLGLSSYRPLDKFVSAVFGAREYAPFPAPNRESILKKVSSILQVEPAAVTPEAAFQCAFPRARSSEDSAGRLDTFLNQYGMCRNVAFASGVAAVILAFNSPDGSNNLLALGAIVLCVGLFARFIKFYAAFAREVFRTFDAVVSSQ